MATILSKLFEKQDTPGASNLHSPKDFFGRVRQAYVELNTTDQPVNNNDVIKLFKLPEGARVLNITVYFGAMGAGTTLKIGDAADDDRYLLLTSVATAGHTTALAATGFGYTIVDGVVLATAGGANYAAGQTLRVMIQFVLD